MEANGPANIMMLLQTIKTDIPRYGSMTPGMVDRIVNTLGAIGKESEMTINYLKEIDTVLKKHGLEKEIPFWHEVKEKYK